MTPVIFINCDKQPFVKDIMGGLKQYETRNKNTLGRFLGQRVLLAETRHGKLPVVKCSAVIAEVVSVHSKEEWDEYLEVSWIPVGSKYDWQPDTKVKWLYLLKDIEAVPQFPLGQQCRRHGRVWAELPDLYCVDYQNTGGGVMCYSALYKGKYWVFGNEDFMGAYSVDPMNTTDEEGYLIDPNEYELFDVTDFPTWREVIESIPDFLCEFYCKGGRSELRKHTLEWQGSLDKPVNICE